MHTFSTLDVTIVCSRGGALRSRGISKVIDGKTFVRVTGLEKKNKRVLAVEKGFVNFGPVKQENGPIDGTRAYRIQRRKNLKADRDFISPNTHCLNTRVSSLF